MKTVVTLALSGLLMASGGSAQAATAQAGTLTCKGGSGVGMILGSKKHYDCVFKRVKGPSETYEASVTKIGLDLGFTSSSTIVWAVFSSSNELSPKALAGEYVGASADASLGIGAGTKVLVGGSKNSISLQPLSVQGQKGLNLSVGVADMKLR